MTNYLLLELFLLFVGTIICNFWSKKIKKIIWYSFFFNLHYFWEVSVFLFFSLKIKKLFSFSRIFRQLNTHSHSNLSSRLIGVIKPMSPDAEIGNETVASAESFLNHSGSDLDDVTVNLIDESGVKNKTQDTKLWTILSYWTTVNFTNIFLRHSKAAVFSWIITILFTTTEFVKCVKIWRWEQKLISKICCKISIQMMVKLNSLVECCTNWLVKLTPGLGP